VLNNFWLNLSGRLEHFIITRLVPKRVGPVMRLVFKLPILFYRLGLGGLIGKHILLLITTGRRSGKTRCTPLEYGYNPQTGAYFLIGGWKGQSDWYRNALAHPRVQIRVGRERIQGVARAASTAEVVKEMEKILRVYPKAADTWSAFSGIPYDGTPASLPRMAEAFPSLVVDPDPGSSGESLWNANMSCG
jgi:deazaflavin-dependent oxidoreductase (nitroreductase family)